MIYTIIIVAILVAALTAGMYFSEYQNINEKLALKKKYFRAENLFYKSPKIKSRLSYSFGTIACLLLVFIVFNDPMINVPLTRVPSAKIFNETIDELIMEHDFYELVNTINIASEARPHANENVKVIDDEDKLFFIAENALLSVNKLSIQNYRLANNIDSTPFYYPQSTVKMKGLLKYENFLITYGKFIKDDNTNESIIYIHNKENLKVQKIIYIRGDIKSVIVQKDELYCIVENKLNKNENYYGKLAGIKFNSSDKYQTNEYKNIQYIPNNNVKYTLGIVKVNLKNYKFDMKSLLVADYFIAINNSKVYISFNKDLKDEDIVKKSYIIEFNLKKMRIEKGHQIEGNIYNDLIFDDSGGLTVTTFSQDNDENIYKIYKYNKNFYLINTYEIISESSEILIQDNGFYYLVNKYTRLIRFMGDRCLTQKSFPIISNVLSLEDEEQFNKVLSKKIILYKRKQDKIELKKYDIMNDFLDQQIEIDTENKVLETIIFDSYYTNGIDYDFINIRTYENQQYTYFIIPYIDNVLLSKQEITFSSLAPIDNISHFYINQHIIVFLGNKILLFSEIFGWTALEITIY